MQSRPFTIGTRGSPLALAQARMVRDGLLAKHKLDDADIEIRMIRTSGDRIRDRALSEVGGKGLFTKEIEEALLEGSIDAAVHSMKDMPTLLPEGLTMACYLPREDPRDAFISRKARRLQDLPPGAVVGSSSLRRQAQVRRLRPDIRVVTYRGNVEGRLRKLAEGVVDATLLACAGLRRLGLEHEITGVIEPEIMLPAVAQGVVGVEIREGDETSAALLATLNDSDADICVRAERAFLAGLDGSCMTPIAALAERDGQALRLRGQILTPDGVTAHETERSGPVGEGEAMGADAAAELLARAGPDFFESVS